MSPDSPSPSGIQPGMLFCDRYRIERRIDEGGMATIYQAVDESSGLPVAIKILFAHYSDNTVVKARFLDEGRIQAMLKHPNIVHVYQVLRQPVLSFVMEYIDGETLDEYLQRKAPLSEQEIVELIMPVMSAVGFAHSKGIVHRDLKPSNVLLQSSAGYAEPKVMDFGVAKVSRGKELTADGTTVGTLHYMSPEQIVGARNIDGRADIYSLGCSLYKLCTGEVPFNASSEFALMMAQVEAPPTPPSDLRGDLSPEMEEIILRALAKEPDNRFQTIREMTQALIKVGDESAPTDTVTRPMPAELLEFALGADEVAHDQTDQFRLEYLATGGELPEADDEPGSPGMTVELSTAAVKKIKSDRLKALRRKEGDADALSQAPTTERPQKFSRAQRDESLIMTAEQPRPAVDKPRFDGEDELQDVLQTIPRSAGMRADKSDDGEAQNIVAVDKPGVDSKEVTHLHIPKGAHEELRSTQEHSRSQRLKTAPKPSVEDVDDENMSREKMAGAQAPQQEASTAAERPSLRAASAVGKSAAPAATDQGGGSETVETADQRPSHRLEKLRRGDDDGVEEATAAERPSLRTSVRRATTATGSAQQGQSQVPNQAPNQATVQADEDAAESGQFTPPLPQRKKASSAQNGLYWIGFGVVALAVALAVLLWVLFAR